MFAMILDDLIAFTYIPRIFEGSALVLLGAEVVCNGFTLIVIGAFGRRSRLHRKRISTAKMVEDGND